MKTYKISRGLTLVYYFLSLGSLISSGIYLRNFSITSALEDLIPMIVFGLLGALWVFLYGEGGRTK